MWPNNDISALAAGADGLLGRTEPPALMFQALRLPVLEQLRGSHGLAPKALTIVAPVGYGKTVLMSMFLAELRRTGRQCLWFALDDRDSSVESVVSALESLLNGQAPSLHPTQALFRGQPSVQSSIDRLIDLLKHYPLPLTLFIDNLNCCTDAALEQLLNQLVFRTPASQQLVLSSTREIPFDIAQAQLRGLVHQIGPTELCFNAEDIAKLLGGPIAGLIGLQGVQDIALQTEGWPAAVRMVHIILSNAEHPRLALKDFSGSDEGLARLLNRRVLSAFPTAVRDFLLCIAPLRTFSLELCRHAMDDDRAREHLAYLLERNVFVIPMDRNRNWYRLHGLFREYLLHEADIALSAARRHTVLSRAATWCEKNGHWRESVEYALASQSADTASHILEQLAPSCIRNSGLVLQYIQWLETLHSMGHQAGPEAEYWFVWALAFHRRYDYARRQSAILAQRVQKLSAKSEGKKNLQRRIAILRASIDSLSDHLQEAHLGTAAWLAEAETGVDDPFNLAAAHCIACGHFSRAFHFVEARQSIQLAQEAAFQSSSPYVAGWVAAYAALILVYEGNFEAAYTELVAALASTQAQLGADSGIGGTLAMVAAKCAAEMGLEEEAWLLFVRGSKSSRTHGFLESAACGLEAAVLLWQGANDDRVVVAQLRDIAAAYSPRLSLMLSCFLIQRMLVLGRAQEARAEAEHIGLESGGASLCQLGQRELQDAPIAQLNALLEDTRLALLMAGGKSKLAEAHIAHNLHQARAQHCALRVVELCLASATLTKRDEQQSLAVRHITPAIRGASNNGIVRPFRDHAQTLAAVVADTKLNAWGFATTDERRFFVDRCRELSFANQSLFDKLASLHAEEPHLATQLTAREMELLGYIDVGLSNQQMADHIGVSLTTVKWHLQNLYAKLDVRNRSAALAKSRALHLRA